MHSPMPHKGWQFFPAHGLRTENAVAEIDYRVIGEISGGDATGLDRVLANMRIAKREFDDVTETYEPIDQIRR